MSFTAKGDFSAVELKLEIITLEITDRQSSLETFFIDRNLSDPISIR